MVPNYIIPSEYEMLDILSRNSGIAIAWDINSKEFIQEKKLKLVWNSDKMPKTDVYLLSRKSNNLEVAFTEIETELRIVLE
jgi:hypothetical protein